MTMNMELWNGNISENSPGGGDLCGVLSQILPNRNRKTPESGIKN